MGATLAIGYCDAIAANANIAARSKWSFNAIATGRFSLVNQHSGFCLEINPNYKMPTGGHVVDVWDCAQAQAAAGDLRTYWTTDGTTITSMFTGATMPPTLELNPFELTSFADVWDCTASSSFMDGRDQWALDGHSRLVSQYGDKSFCLVALVGSGLTQLQYCGSVTSNVLGQRSEVAI